MEIDRRNLAVALEDEAARHAYLYPEKANPRTILRMILSPLRGKKKIFWMWLLHGLAFGIRPMLSVFVLGRLVRLLEQGATMERFLVVAALVAGLYFLLSAIVAQTDARIRATWMIFRVKLINRMLSQYMRMDFGLYENAKFLDVMRRWQLAFSGNETGLEGIWNRSLEGLGQLISALLLTLGGIFWILIDFSIGFTLVLVGLSVVSLLIMGRALSLQQKTMENLIPVNRRYGYYVNTAVGADFQKDFRLFQMQPMIERKVESYVKSINLWFAGLWRTTGHLETGTAVVASLLRFATWGYVALRTAGTRFGPQIGLGQFAVLVAAAERFTGAFKDLVQALLSSHQAFNMLQPFTEFMLWPETAQQGKNLVPGALEELRFENVRFTYPNTDRLILDDISFAVGKGEKISIVGVNNAGKSTIVKLIARLFTPDAGRILWNGTDIRDLDYDAYMERLSAVFQDFQLFPFTIRTNLERSAEDQDEALYELLAEVDMKQAVETFPKGLDTGLDKSLYEEATDFSGGQKQKLAIARAIHKQADLVILDEPTAALDPLAESEVYAQFHALTRGKTAIFISHRMSSSLFCDRILLLQDGKVAAFDSHKNLMKGHNLYRQLFETQAAHYQFEPA